MVFVERSVLVASLLLLPLSISTPFFLLFVLGPSYIKKYISLFLTITLLSFIYASINHPSIFDIHVPFSSNSNLFKINAISVVFGSDAISTIRQKCNVFIDSLLAASQGNRIFFFFAKFFAFVAFISIIKLKLIPLLVTFCHSVSPRLKIIKAEVSYKQPQKSEMLTARLKQEEELKDKVKEKKKRMEERNKERMEEWTKTFPSPFPGKPRKFKGEDSGIVCDTKFESKEEEEEEEEEEEDMDGMMRKEKEGRKRREKEHEIIEKEGERNEREQKEREREKEKEERKKRIEVINLRKLDLEKKMKSNNTYLSNLKLKLKRDEQQFNLGSIQSPEFKQLLEEEIEKKKEDIKIILVENKSIADELLNIKNLNKLYIEIDR